MHSCICAIVLSSSFAAFPPCLDRRLCGRKSDRGRVLRQFEMVRVRGLCVPVIAPHICPRRVPSDMGPRRAAARRKRRNKSTRPTQVAYSKKAALPQIARVFHLTLSLLRILLMRSWSSPSTARSSSAMDSLPRIIVETANSYAR